MRVILLHTLYFTPFVFSLSHRLGRRKILFEKRKKISDYALVMGMFGIIIMVIENELSSAGVYNKEDVMSTGLKTLISISTVVLLVLIVAYHMLEIQVQHVYGDFPNGNVGGQEGIIKFKSRFNSWFWHQSLCKFSQIVWFAEMDVGSGSQSGGSNIQYSVEKIILNMEISCAQQVLVPSLEPATA